MRKLFLLVSLFYSTNAVAQTAQKVDSIYYLLDTAKTPVNDRIWDVYTQGLVTFYTIKIPCSCPGLMNEPTFYCSSRWGHTRIVDRGGLKSIPLVTLPNLIKRIKEFADEDSHVKNELKKQFFIFFVEPKNGKYVVHKAVLDGSGKKRVTTDYEIIETDTTGGKKQ